MLFYESRSVESDQKISITVAEDIDEATKQAGLALVNAKQILLVAAKRINELYNGEYNQAFSVEEIISFFRLQGVLSYGKSGAEVFFTSDHPEFLEHGIVVHVKDGKVKNPKKDIEF